jgi:hypothetical protein
VTSKNKKKNNVAKVTYKVQKMIFESQTRYNYILGQKKRKYKTPRDLGVWQGVARLPKVLPRPAMPYPTTPCGRDTPETAVLYPFGHPTPSAYAPRDRSRKPEGKKISKTRNFGKVHQKTKDVDKG